ncbi:MAG: VWA domain-containing protein [Actinobacteria bacterium]|nr:VWA domain-containing protein [Actinomycetota bacterium]
MSSPDTVGQASPAGSSGFDALLVDFGHALRAAGLPVGTDDILTFCEAVSHLDVSDLMDVYWSGRTTMVRRREHVPVYNLVFRMFFLDVDPVKTDERKRMMRASANAGATLEIPNTEPGLPGDVSPDEAKLGYVASTSEVYRHKAFSDCTDDELRQLRRLMSRMRITPPRRRTHRTAKARRSATLDMRRMARDAMRSLGEPHDLAYKQRKHKLRPLVLILDVSGSMADYSRNLLQFAYSAKRANAKVEVFCFGTRLSRITKSLDRRDPDEAMRQAGEAVLDWDGGTRIGDSLREYTREVRRSRLGRGAIVVVCSDGLDRGDPQQLEDAMETLSRLAHRIIWVNPHKGDAPVYVPASLGMIIADPYIDEVHSGHNLASLERLAERLPKVG